MQPTSFVIPFSILCSVVCVPVPVAAQPFHEPAQTAPAAPTPSVPTPNPNPTPPTDVESDLERDLAPSPDRAPSPDPTLASSSSELAEIQASLARDAKSGAPPSSGPTGAGVQSMNPDVSVIGAFALAAFSEAENHQTGGHDPTQNGFNLQQLELAFAASVDPYFRFDSHLVFGPEGFELEEAYGTTLALPARLQARFGQFLSRFGRLNSTHAHRWDFVDQPFALGRVFGGDGNRGLGAELSYLTPLPWYLELVASASRADGEGTARSFFGEEEPGVQGVSDLLYVTAIKQFFPLSHDWSLNFGLSAAFGPNASGADNRSEVYGADLYVKFRPITRQSHTQLTLQSEWLYRRRQLPGSVLADTSGYVQVVYRFAQRWASGGRYEYGTPARDRSGVVAPDPLDPEWTRSRTRATLALSFLPTEFSLLRLQGSRDAGLGAEPVWAAFLAAELAIGAHGAHAF